MSGCYSISNIVTIWLLLNEDASWNKQSVIGRLFGADNRPKHYWCTSSIFESMLTGFQYFVYAAISCCCRQSLLSVVHFPLVVYFTSAFAGWNDAISLFMLLRSFHVMMQVVSAIVWLCVRVPTAPGKSWKVMDFFSWKSQDLESPGKSLWSWKVLEIKAQGLRKSWKNILESLAASSW